MFSKKEVAIVNNLRFTSWTSFMLSRFEHEKSFITLGPGQTAISLDKRSFQIIIFSYFSTNISLLMSTTLKKYFILGFELHRCI